MPNMKSMNCFGLVMNLRSGPCNAECVSREVGEPTLRALKISAFLNVSGDRVGIRNASGESSTRKAKLRPELYFRFIRRNAFSAVELLDAALDGGKRLCSIQAFQDELIAFRVLNRRVNPVRH
jgi:hypothetical protein